MPRFNVEHNGEWACFSTVCEDFITQFMPFEEYELWRSFEYGQSKCPFEQSNKMTYEEAIRRKERHTNET